MPLPLVMATASLLCGLAVGEAVRWLLPRPSGPAWEPRPPRHPAWRLLHPLVLGLASLGLSQLPALADPLALSQALLLLYLLYPLALLDALTLRIEPALVLGGIVLRVAFVLVLRRAEAADMLGGLLGGTGLLALVGFAYAWVRGREGLGEGDPALLGLIGAFVGWRGLLPVVLLGTATGLLAGAPGLLLLRRPLNTPLPFAPFLCVGGLLVYLLQVYGWGLFGFLPALA